MIGSAIHQKFFCYFYFNLKYFKKKYTNPEMFIEDGKKYLEEGNEVQASEKVFVLTLKLLVLF
jgi:hypothetical protein